MMEQRKHALFTFDLRASYKEFIYKKLYILLLYIRWKIKALDG